MVHGHSYIDQNIHAIFILENLGDRFPGMKIPISVKMGMKVDAGQVDQTYRSPSKKWSKQPYPVIANSGTIIIVAPRSLA